jgi:hypothetical protein
MRRLQSDLMERINAAREVLGMESATVHHSCVVCSRPRVPPPINKPLGRPCDGGLGCIVQQFSSIWRAWHSWNPRSWPVNGCGRNNLECAFSWAYERRSLDARNAAVSRRHKYPQNAHPASSSCILYPSRLFSNPPPFPELSFSAFPSFEISSGIFILTN